MAEAIKFGLSAPVSISRAGGVALVLAGGVMVLAFLSWYLVTNKMVRF